MASFKILIEGYAKKLEDGWKASSTTVLIKDSGKNILADPGINKPLLLERLKEEGLTPEDIDIVFLTHYHPDHIFLAALFDKALALDGDIIYEKDILREFKDKIPGTNVEVVLTPGHAHEHASLVFETSQGKVAVAGDVFWWTDEEEQKTDEIQELIKKPDPFVKDIKALQESRKILLREADFIIPGHGKMFKNPLKT